MDRAPFSDMRPTTKSGGRQLPWLGDRNFDDVHRRTADGLPHVCGIALANAFPHATAGSRPPLLFAGANVCRCNGDFRDAQTHVQPRAGGVSPPWLGNVRAAEVENPQQTRSRATQGRGTSPPVVVHHVRAAAIVSSMSAVSLARPCDGLRIARELTSSTDFSTAGETVRLIADYGRLAWRISPRLARTCEGLRAAGEASASPD
jgi:hypothetical protein